MKKLFVSLLCVVMMVTFMPSMAFAETLANDTAVISIHSEDDLKKIGNDENYPLNGNYVLADNITLSDGNWTPIGSGIRAGSGFTTESKPFTGTFDGKGHTISGMKVSTEGSQSKDYALGLFGIVSGGTVKNLNLENVSIIALDNEMAGGAIGMLTNGGTAENITVSGEISVKRGNGGIVGRMTKSGTVTGCVNNATIKGTGANVGGIVGAAYYTITYGEMYISDCVNNGTVSGEAGVVGGIAGLSAAHISNCKNTAAVSGNGADVAGIAAEQQNYGSIKNCTNTGTITNTSNEYGTGGIVGWIRYNGAIDNYQKKAIIEVKDNLNTASVSGGNDAGGIVGTVYNAAVVTGNENRAAELTGKSFAAGIVGNLQFTETPEGGISLKNILIKNNISGTALEDIEGNCKNLYVYNNHTKPDDSIIIRDNGTDWLAQVGEKKYASLQSAVTAASSGETVKVLSNIDLPSQLTVNKKLVLDLNGKTLSNSTVIWNDDQKHWSYVSVVENGDLTITGNGVMQTKKKDCYAIDLRGGSCNIENGTFIGNVHAVYVHDGALNVYGGNFSVQQKHSDAQPDQFVLNCLDENYKNGTAKITVYGGTYAGFNPGNCEAEGKGTNFLASGYEVKENEDNTFTVEKTEVPPYIPPTPTPTPQKPTIEAEEGATVTLSKDGTTATIVVDKDATLKDVLLNGKSLGSVTEVKDLKTGDKLVVVVETAAEKNDRLKAGVENTTIKMYYKKGEIGKGWIKLRYKKSYGYKVDNYEIFRSAKKKTNFGDEAWFVTKTNKTKGYYKNGKSVKKGTRYYYKMRGVREIAGETVYTKWSNIVMRTGR